MKTNNNKHNWYVNKSASAGVLATKLSVTEIKALTETIIREQTIKTANKTPSFNLTSIKTTTFIKQFINGATKSNNNKTFVVLKQNI